MAVKEEYAGNNFFVKEKGCDDIILFIHSDLNNGECFDISLNLISF